MRKFLPRDRAEKNKMKKVRIKAKNQKDKCLREQEGSKKKKKKDMMLKLSRKNQIKKKRGNKKLPKNKR